MNSPDPTQGRRWTLMRAVFDTYGPAVVFWLVFVMAPLGLQVGARLGWDGAWFEVVKVVGLLGTVGWMILWRLTLGAGG